MWRREREKKSGNRIVVCTRKNVYQKFAYLFYVLFSIVLASEVCVCNKSLDAKLPNIIGIEHQLMEAG